MSSKCTAWSQHLHPSKRRTPHRGLFDDALRSTPFDTAAKAKAPTLKPLVTTTEVGLLKSRRCSMLSTCFVYTSLIAIMIAPLTTSKPNALDCKGEQGLDLGSQPIKFCVTDPLWIRQASINSLAATAMDPSSLPKIVLVNLQTSESSSIRYSSCSLLPFLATCTRTTRQLAIKA